MRRFPGSRDTNGLALRVACICPSAAPSTTVGSGASCFTAFRIREKIFLSTGCAGASKRDERSPWLPIPRKERCRVSRALTCPRASPLRGFDVRIPSRTLQESSLNYLCSRSGRRRPTLPDAVLDLTRSTRAGRVNGRGSADRANQTSFATSRIGRVERRIRERISAPSIAAMISWARLRASRRSIPPFASTPATTSIHSSIARCPAYIMPSSARQAGDR